MNLDRCRFALTHLLPVGMLQNGVCMPSTYCAVWILSTTESFNSRQAPNPKVLTIVITVDTIIRAITITITITITIIVFMISSSIISKPRRGRAASPCPP